MREDIWTVIKYKPKPGCEDEFEQALKRLGDMMIENKPYEFINDFELVYRLSKKYDLVNSDEIVSKNRLHYERLSNKRFILMQTELLIFLNDIAVEIISPFTWFLNFYERFKCIMRLYRYKFFNV